VSKTTGRFVLKENDRVTSAETDVREGKNWTCPTGSTGQGGGGVILVKGQKRMAAMNRR